ncbi:MAG TPA: hypothetical protein VLV15_04070, partial [Dongiaceae bacterium]|nr:hypothetical protein [Dongiaceae bacterium]
NLAYLWWLAALLWLLVPRHAPAPADGAPARRESRVAWVWARLPERGRLLVRTIAVPLAVWFTIPYPNRVREFFGFIANRDSGSPFWTASGLLFYPRALATEYLPAPWLTWLVLALAGGTFLLRRATAPVRLARLACAVALALTVAHRFRDFRFLFTVTPLLWLCAATSLVRLVDAVLRLLPSARARDAIVVTGMAVTFAGAWLATPGADAVRERRLRYRTPATIAPALDSLLAVTAGAEAATRPDRVALLGYSNVLSPGLLKWRARLVPPPAPVERMPARVPTLDPGATEAELAARLEWLDARSDLVIAALADSSVSWAGDDYRGETWADHETAARLERDPGHWAPGPRMRVAGFEIRSFRARRP